MRHIRKVFILVGLAFLALKMSYAADAWPIKPIRFIVGFTAGGPSDIIARSIAQKMSVGLGQSIIIDNKPGAGGNLAAEYVAHSPADGYTWLLGNNSILATNAALYKNLGFNPTQDFIPIGLVASQPNILVVNTALPVKNLKELIALAKQKPGQLNFASSGMGAAPHLSGELFKTSANIQIVHIPYKGAQPALVDLIAGHVNMMFATSASVIPFIKDRRVKPIAVTSLQRLKDFPQIPTMSESGLPGFEMVSWHGIVVPSGVPDGIVQRIDAELQVVQNNPELLAAFKALGMTPSFSNSKEFSEYIKTEIPKWTKTVHDSGATE
jgi:tripartite-type tricarboxylate transporter receptor subunit TctC